jgi:hypothetical protein
MPAPTSLEVVMDRCGASGFALLALLLAVAWAHPEPARAQLNVSLQGIHMDPSDQDARDFSHTSFGGGLHVRFGIPYVGKVIAGGAGIELISMLSETHTFQDRQTGLVVEQQTEQDYLRVYLGPEIGSRGPGFFRPHLGAHVAFINYGISTDVVIPNDTNPENEIRQSLSSLHRAAAGYDLDAGADLNFGRWYVAGGTRFAKSFNVPQQLGQGTVTIHPGYIQIYLGIGANFSTEGL